MSNHNHGVLKERWNAVISAQTEERAVRMKLDKVQKEANTAATKTDACEKSLASAIWNKCHGKMMVYKGSLYRAIQVEGLVTLKVEEFRGEVVD